MAGVAASPHLGDVISDALRYWELSRLLYNVVLTAVVLGRFWYFWPHSTSSLLLNHLLGLFVLTVLANVCCSAAYVADVFVQLSGYRARPVRFCCSFS